MRKDFDSKSNVLTSTFESIWTTVRKHVKQAGPALVALALFLAVAFTFVLKGDQRQALGTVLVADATEQADVKEDTASATAEPVQAYAVGEKLEKMTPLPPQTIDTETLWLARGIYSETKEPQEQELVAWTVRNRVETQYRGNGSYQEAVLDPYQYSAFIEGTATREHYANLPADSDEPGFQTAVAIAKQVKEAPAAVRPFKQTTRHFYSEQSMVGGKAPKWAVGEEPVKPARPIELDEKRFRFYADVR